MEPAFATGSSATMGATPAAASPMQRPPGPGARRGRRSLLRVWSGIWEPVAWPEALRSSRSLRDPLGGESERRAAVAGKRHVRDTELVEQCHSDILVPAGNHHLPG